MPISEEGASQKSAERILEFSKTTSVMDGSRQISKLNRMEKEKSTRGQDRKLWDGRGVTSHGSVPAKTPPSFHVGDLPGQVPRVLNQVSRDPWRAASSGTIWARRGR